MRYTACSAVIITRLFVKHKLDILRFEILAHVQLMYSDLISLFTLREFLILI